MDENKKVKEEITRKSESLLVADKELETLMETIPLQRLINKDNHGSPQFNELISLLKEMSKTTYEINIKYELMYKVVKIDNLLALF